VIPDELHLISDEVRNFSKAYDYVFTTGGVGPTHDDLTMEGVAEAFGRRIRRNAELEANIRHFYARELVDGNLGRADVPEGARLVGGKGLWFPVVAVENVYIFPGVPEILQKKFERVKNPVYSIKLTLESKDPAYVDRAQAALVTQLAKLDLHPLNVRF
jgi:molybdopterin-biosynthesis enzyme MoeA-like protein